MILATMVLLFPAVALGESNAPDQAIVKYENLLKSVSEGLTNHNWVSNYKLDIQNNHNIYCNPSKFCGTKEIERLLLSIQDNDFHFVQPISLPQSGQELLAAVKHSTVCNNLGFMNVAKLPTDSADNVPPVPWRPTEGFGIYKLPITGKKTLLIRGSRYNLAWPFWGADISGDKLPPVPQGKTYFGRDFLTELTAEDCRVVRQFQLESLQTVQEPNYTHTSFSEPVMIAGKLYILEIIAGKTDTDPTASYDLTLLKIDMFTGLVVGELDYPTYWGKPNE